VLVQDQYRRDEIQMNVSQQHVYSAIALNELVFIWSHQIYGGMEIRVPFVMSVSQKGWTYTEIDVGGVAVTYFRV
jgi:hypothetical protein